MIRSLDKVSDAEFIYLNDKITNRGWFLSLQLNTILNYMLKGRIHEAITCPRHRELVCDRCADNQDCPFVNVGKGEHE